MDSPNATLPDQERAERSAAAMWANDRASQGLGMDLAAVGPGTATLTMRVREDMLNGLSTCHGGFIFTLADSAFAFACNSYKERVVAQHCSVTFHAAALEGDLLTAVAREVTRSGRSGLYDIAVTREDGTLIASFRGHSRMVKGSHYEDA
ncbi:hydroxyphenylacetyl-CoA thioesterase PaaI [Aurantimonas sp. VKM B-3413]|uniref:hydroxyphenylacetyl-CoA thioesterase PaaI n=1 Tax=Aurantimonas sp. VKM B-3413 TaxID=2779401 RepID=UPI001E3B3750|nr:hydroxyphenylacetyl-CoA thioesterase PaaI [Aurantimonas sp. VKM B-3413]MCB8836376.1 hydroxyphenylacetyl-CoA thioesterase PaaI [Aurantimonas sp. VKM B-3413]